MSEIANKEQTMSSPETAPQVPTPLPQINIDPSSSSQSIHNSPSSSHRKVPPPVPPKTHPLQLRARHSVSGDSSHELDQKGFVISDYLESLKIQNSQESESAEDENEKRWNFRNPSEFPPVPPFRNIQKIYPSGASVGNSLPVPTPPKQQVQPQAYRSPPSPSSQSQGSEPLKKQSTASLQLPVKNIGSLPQRHSLPEISQSSQDTSASARETNSSPSDSLPTPPTASSSTLSSSPTPTTISTTTSSTLPISTSSTSLTVSFSIPKRPPPRPPKKRSISMSHTALKRPESQMSTGSESTASSYVPPSVSSPTFSPMPSAVFPSEAAASVNASQKTPSFKKLPPPRPPKKTTYKPPPPLPPKKPPPAPSEETTTSEQ